jgi:DnaJ-domain-containing protein 1
VTTRGENITMSMKDRIFRTMRANLNDLVDRVNEFEQQGGFRRIVEPIAEEMGWEEIGASRPRTRSGEKTIRDYYANLEVPFGSDLDTVKESYRRLMRKYHPDKHAHDPNAEALATELTQELTKAYQAIESYLQTGRY